jgi:hypothetical protein
MLVHISVTDDDVQGHATLTTLFRWLRQDLQSGAQWELRPRRSTDAQGGAFEVINALIGDSVGVGGLALSYAAWRQAHRSPSKITFERDGLTVTVEDASPESLRLIADALADPATPAGEGAGPDPAGSQPPNDPGPDHTH